MKWYLILASSLFFYIGTWAQTGLSLSMQLAPESQVLGCPIEIAVSIENMGKSNALVPTNMGGYIYLVMRLHVEGTAAAESSDRALDGHVQWESLPPGGKITYWLHRSAGPIACQPGKSILWAEYDDTKQVVPPTAPVHMVSGRVSVEYTAPKGEDEKAFAAAIAAMRQAKFNLGTCEANGVSEWFSRSGSSLARFPKSTYAAYAICEPMRHIFDGDKNKFERGLETGVNLLPGSVPDDTGKSIDGWQSLGGRDLAAWKAKWIDIVLKYHPDLWFADDLKLVRAADQIALKNYQAAQADLEPLSKQAGTDVASKATWLLGVMRQRGWIKN